MNVMTEPLQRPWWKEPMIWLVAGLPAIAVIASFTTYFIAADKPDTLVNDGYHKEGMAPGKDTSLETRAITLGVSGELVIVNGEARIKLFAQLASMPDSLELLLLHPTQAEHDLRIRLNGIGQGLYSGAISGAGAGKKKWILEPSDHGWRLTGELSLPLAGSLKLGSDAFHNHP